MKYNITNEKITLYLTETEKQYTLEKLFEIFDISRKNRYLLKMNHQILLDDRPLLQDNEALNGNELCILREKENPDWIAAERPAKVVFENDLVTIVHKEAGIIIHGEETDTTCLNARVARYYLDHNIHSFVRPIHRLDKDTCGLVLYVKVAFFQPWFDKQLQLKNIYRHYLAICMGKRPKKDFTCNLRIGKDRHNAGKYRISSSGKEARTFFTLEDSKKDYHLIGCRLDTGRTHQIRVHLSAYGLSIVNDPLYGIYTRDFKHMGLWADTITFRNPLNNKKHTIYDFPQKDYKLFLDTNDNTK